MVPCKPKLFRATQTPKPHHFPRPQQVALEFCQERDALEHGEAGAAPCRLHSPRLEDRAEGVLLFTKKVSLKDVSWT